MYKFNNNNKPNTTAKYVGLTDTDCNLIIRCLNSVKSRLHSHHFGRTRILCEKSC